KNKEAPPPGGWDSHPMSPSRATATVALAKRPILTPPGRGGQVKGLGTLSSEATMRRVTGAVSVWAVLYLLFVPLAAQETARGKVSGTVADSATRQAITGAVVTVSGTTLSASTNAGGYFVIENVPAGTHDLIVKRLGYRPATA